uniref:Uncharacterized protein n=1 Tax=Cyanoderma ruficeps TaxID=181631 RepID=A0A8C3X8B5_9PASS
LIKPIQDLYTPTERAHKSKPRESESCFSIVASAFCMPSPCSLWGLLFQAVCATEVNSSEVYPGWTPWFSTCASIPLCLLPLCVCPESWAIFIIVLVSTYHQLHHPMYYFLCNFAFLESACIPKTLANLVSQSQSISSTGCLLQMYFFFSFSMHQSFIVL